MAEDEKENFFKHDWDKPIMHVPPQEVKLLKIPMDPETRASLILGVVVVLCISGLVAFLIYALMRIFT